MILAGDINGTSLDADRLWVVPLDKGGGRSVRDVVRIAVTTRSLLLKRAIHRRSEMVRENEIRKAEVAGEMPPATNAGLVFIGRIHTP